MKANNVHPLYGTSLTMHEKMKREKLKHLKTVKSHLETVGEDEFNRRKDLYMKENHDKYLKETLMIGFMEKFPEIKEEVIDEITVQSKCKGYDVTFKVRYGKLSFGEGNAYKVSGITTDVVDISHKLPLHGFNSMCCYNEAETMEKAVTEMAAKHSLIVCQKICSWPHAKVVVQPIEDAHVRSYVEKVL